MSLTGKLNPVKRFWVNLTENVSTPSDFNYVCIIRRIREKSNCYVHDGVVNGLECKLKIDTSSDVSIVNSKSIDSSLKKIPINFPLKYSTGNSVSVHFKTEVT